jgi:hypothetical protein
MLGISHACFFQERNFSDGQKLDIGRLGFRKIQQRRTRASKARSAADAVDEERRVLYLARH